MSAADLHEKLTNDVAACEENFRRGHATLLQLAAELMSLDHHKVANAAVRMGHAGQTMQENITYRAQCNRMLALLEKGQNGGVPHADDPNP